MSQLQTQQKFQYPMSQQMQQKFQYTMSRQMQQTPTWSQQNIHWVLHQQAHR